MQAVLEDLQSQVDDLRINVVPSTGKKVRGTKTHRLKTVKGIHNHVAKKIVRAALTAASTHEMVCGPQDGSGAGNNHNHNLPNPGESKYLGWVGLVSALLEALRDACDDALNSRTTAKSGLASMRPDFMRTLRRAIKFAMQDGPKGVLRPLAPALLHFAHDMLAEPAMRKVLADDLWQCVRDFVHDSCNRAMLSPPFIRTWIDDCFQQLTGRGPMRHASQVATSLAGEVLQILATPIGSFDILTQSSHGISASKMLGGDFLYAMICQRCCLMLLVADSLPRRQGRDLQEVAIRTLTIGLSDHALDVCDSSALQSIINLAFAPILSCWAERKSHDAALSLCKTLLSIAPNNRVLMEGIRNRIRDDVTDVNSSALLRAGKDVRDDYISTAAFCFSFREALEFASAEDALEGHIIIWLRVAACIMSGRVLKRETTVLIDPRDVFDQCARAAEVVSQILKRQNTTRGNSFIDIVHWACELVNLSACTANRILLAGYISAKTIYSRRNKALEDTAKWCTLYQTLREVLSSLSFSASSRTPGHSRSDALNTDESVARSVTFLSSLELISDTALDSRVSSSSSHSNELPFPLSRILSSHASGGGRNLVSRLDVGLLRNLVARTGFNDEDGTGLRYRLVQALFSLCTVGDPESNLSNAVATATDPNVLIEASAAVVGLMHGECGLSDSQPADPHCALYSPPMQSLLHEMLFSGLTIGATKIDSRGDVLVKRMRDQDIIWTSFLHGGDSHQNDLHGEVESVFKRRRDATSSRNHSMLSLSRHFAISANLSNKIELDMLSKITESLHSLCSSSRRSDSSEHQQDEADGDERMDDDNVRVRVDELQFSDANASKKGLRILLFVCNYLLVALRHGLLDTAETKQSKKHTSSCQFISVVTQLFSCLGNFDVSIVTQVPELTQECISVCCGLATALEDESRREEWSAESPWQTACTTLPGMLTRFATKLSEHLVKVMVAPMKESKKRIAAFAGDVLEDPIAPSSASVRKRARMDNVNANSNAPHKRARMESMAGDSQFSDEEGFPDDSDDEAMAVNNTTSSNRNQGHDDSDSEDDFGDESLRVKRERGTTVGSQQVNPTIGEIMAICDLLKILVIQMPSASEAILECLLAGLNTILEIQQMTVPGGFERTAFFSSLIDPTALRARQCLWDVLFSVGSTPALIAAGKDIHRFGKHWRTLEYISQSYVLFHIDQETMKRKSHPLPPDLEDSRIIFLDYARRFLVDVKTYGCSHSTEYTMKSEEVRKVIRGMVDVAEYFRLNHAFKMPRKARLAYLKFGASVIVLQNEGLLTDSTPAASSSEDSQLLITDKVSLIQSAICKLLSDPEAVVRFVAARVVARVFSAWQSFPMLEVEKIFAENLPQNEMCQDSPIIYGPPDDESDNLPVNDENNPWNLTSEEYLAKSKLKKSFQKVGSKSKGLSSLIALGEISAARDDLIPFLFLQIASRNVEKSNLVTCAYSIIVRICIFLELDSPHRLYQAFSRAILPRLLGPPRKVDDIYSFPAPLVLDSNHHDKGVLYDWLRKEQATFLPHLLVQENEDGSFEKTREFANCIGKDTLKLLEDNVLAYVTVYPMQFSPGNNARGQTLWKAIDDALDGRAFTLMSKKKDDVVLALLMCTSGHFACRYGTKNRYFDVEKEKGFSRDTRSLVQPYYDPLVVASAINQLFGQSDSTSIVPKNVLRGSLFSNIVSEYTGSRVADQFPFFMKECRKANSSLLKCLLGISKALDPALTCRSVHNRLDGYFCVGLLWLMLGVEIVMKPANERLLFYKLLSKGFQYAETCADASWLLIDVQKKLLSVKRINKDFQVFDSDLSTRPEDLEHLDDLDKTEERLMYELVRSVTPTLVSVITNNASLPDSPIRDYGQSALRRLLFVCKSEGLWKVIVCNGAFPGGRYFKDARDAYEKAIHHVEGGVNQNELTKIFSCLKRFHGVYQQHDKSHSIASSLACLQELRFLMTDSNVFKLSQQLENEAWRQSNGEKIPTATLLGSSVATLVNLLRDVNSETLKSRSGFLLDDTALTTRVVFQGRLEEQVLRAVADVLNTLGLVQGHSSTFLHMDTRRQPIPAKHIYDKYQDLPDGLLRSIFWLVDVLRSGQSVSADAALKSLAAIIQSVDGRYLFNTKRDELFPIFALRGSDRKGSSDTFSVATEFGYDPRNGDVVVLSRLPNFDDAPLWDLEAFTFRNDGGHEAWFRCVCTVLCSKCSSSANQSLAVACYSSYSLSCNVFPYILMDIVCDLTPESRQRFSKLIKDYVFDRESTPPEILRIFVHALDVLCQIGLTLICEKGIKELQSQTINENTVISYLYVLDIPYSVATKAALKCGASFSAVRYASLYVDHKVMEKEHNSDSSGDRSDRRGKSSVGRAPEIEDVEQEALRIARSWVGEAFVQVNEMDGIRAFSPSHTLADAAASISSIDGDWPASLSTLGVVSRFDSVSNNRGQFVDLRRELETFRALIGIGNLNVATSYWDGLLNKIARDGLHVPEDQSLSTSSVVQKMNDLRYAAAWKLEHWEIPTLISSKTEEANISMNDRFSGFHHALYRMLHFIKTDRTKEIPQALNLGRSQVLNNLCRDNSGLSAQCVSEASAQLRVFHIIESTGGGISRPSACFGRNAAESAGWSLGCTPQRVQNPMSSSLMQNSNFSIPTSNSGDRLSADLELVLGGYFGIDDFDSRGVVPSRDAFTGSILTEDLPVVLIRCLGRKDRVAQAAATASTRILCQGNSGAWARSACCLGTTESSLLKEATRVDRIAWKLQDCRLRWAASDDARTRKRALNEVKETILKLGGKFIEHVESDAYGKQQSLSWTGNDSELSSDAGHLAFLRAEACRLAADWSLDMKTQEPMDLFQTYLEQGLVASQSSTVQKLIGRAHFAMANFADVQISNIDAYRRSRKYEQMVAALKDSEEHVERLRAMKKERVTKGKQPSRRRNRLSTEPSVVPNNVIKDIDHFINLTTRQARHDRSKLEKLNENYKKWQELGCGHFAACLRDGNTHDLRAAFRMVALWLDSGDMRDNVTKSLTGQSNGGAGSSVRVPVGKLLPLAPQLMSRLNYSDSSVFQKTLTSTITNMTSKYPVYCLWQLLSLSNITRGSGNGERFSTLYRGDTDKKNAAAEIFRRLESTLGEILRDMKKASDAYINLVETPLPENVKEGQIHDIGRSQLVRQGELRNVAVPTIALPMQASQEYCRRLPHIKGFDRRSRVLSGLSVPLKIKCIGSDGKIYEQLVKGRDDLRGDAVMEQMFTIMNSLLERDREASKRNLYIRTYRIIPLSPFTGITQFVGNTKQFKELLIDKDLENRRSRAGQSLSTAGSLHERYRPQDMRHHEILLRAHNEYKQNKTNAPKRMVFMRQVFREFHPVFRYFFIEQWPDPAEWFNHQMNYSRSSAVMSIVGFILGLGDRHLSNILVDIHSAEVIHIDFGIAFEGGKLLPQPEHMPFRLTRDLVDGFGIAGVEGVFRKCSEITLSVMRRHRDVLLTVVEVLLHDPMFNWALTPEEVLREQLNSDMKGDAGNDGAGVRRGSRFADEITSSSGGESSLEAVAMRLKRDSGGSREAQRALNRIHEKLDGLEGTERLSIEAHVARLIDEARAFHVIGPVFPGWTPWL